MSNQNQHLRRRGAVYHYRRRLPAPIKEILNETYFDGSLATADPVLARKLARRISVALDQLAERLQGMPSARLPTPGQLNLVLKELFDAILRDGDRRRELQGDCFTALGSWNRQQIADGEADSDELEAFEDYKRRGIFYDEVPETTAERWRDYPDSYLAPDDGQSLAIRKDFIRSYLQRDVGLFGPRLPSETLERLWTMLAHSQGGLLNASKFAASLGVSAQTVTRYIDLLADLLLVHRLPPYRINVGKRLVKSPKVYVRDSGLVHALLGIPDFNALAGHPVVGASWEGFVIENLLAAAPEGAMASFYRTSAGAEVDLVLELPGGEAWAMEIKRGLTTKPRKGFHNAREDLKPDKSFIVYSGEGRYPATEEIEVIGLRELTETLAQTT